MNRFFEQELRRNIAEAFLRERQGFEDARDLLIAEGQATVKVNTAIETTLHLEAVVMRYLDTERSDG